MQQDNLHLHFWTRLGKTRLRPGGKLATDWLLANGDFRQEKKVLNIVCNSGATAIEIALRFGCQVVGVDANQEELENAHTHILEQKAEHLVTLRQAEPNALPFEDNSFDIVINEALLTMLPADEKAQVIKECLRVLKPNGFLLTHDVMLSGSEGESVLQALRDALDIPLAPLYKEQWKTTFIDCGFRNVETFSGEMTLLSPKGLIYDEGVVGALKILRNALKIQNRDTFKKMLRAFNHQEKTLGFIAVCSQK